MLDEVLKGAILDAAGEASISEALTKAHALGFGGALIPAELPHFSLDRMTGDELDGIAAHATSLGIGLSLRGPISASLRSGPPELRAAVLTYYGRLLNAAERAGAVSLHVHLGPPLDRALGVQGALPEAVDAAMRHDLGKDLLRLAGLTAGRCNLCILSDDLDPGAIEVLAPLVRDDLVHLGWSASAVRLRDPAVEQLFDAFAYRVRAIHLGAVGPESTHAVPKGGVQPFRGLVERFGPMDVREWSLGPAAASESLAYLRALSAQSGP
ncbi:MAG: hypothetical protein HUU17_04445 [Chthonomonadales bacterium]|nr:hypothetical protein [Chthonomonadales bacterium]